MLRISKTPYCESIGRLKLVKVNLQKTPDSQQKEWVYNTPQREEKTSISLWPGRPETYYSTLWFVKRSMGDNPRCKAFDLALTMLISVPEHLSGVLINLATLLERQEENRFFSLPIWSGEKIGRVGRMVERPPTFRDAVIFSRFVVFFWSWLCVRVWDYEINMNDLKPTMNHSGYYVMVLVAV